MPRWILVAVVVFSVACGGEQTSPSPQASAPNTQVNLDAFSPQLYPTIQEELQRLRAERGQSRPLQPVDARPSRATPFAGVTKFELLRGEIEPNEFKSMVLPRSDEYSIRHYAAEVQAELGAFPTFNPVTLGTVIPITTDGAVIPSGSHTSLMKCDRPVWLGLGSGGQCAPYARIGVLQGTDPSITWVFIARRYTIRTNPDDPVFEDVAVIGHHPQTGRAAFFQMLDANGKVATRVPSPMEPASATPPGAPTPEDFWLTPADTARIRCNSCHDADPFIHSPYVDQAQMTTPSGLRPVVPTVPFRKYSFIGTQAFTAWPQPQHFKPTANVCVRCHRMGSTTRGTQTFTNWATGVNPPQVSELFGKYPLSHWMPPGESAQMPEAEWNSNYRSSADQILACIASPTTPACNTTPVPR